MKLKSSYSQVGLFILSFIGLSFNCAIGQCWNETIMLTPSDPEEYDKFGISVAISANYAVVGALGKTDDDGKRGAAYIYELIDGVWIEVAKLTASDGTANDFFGNSVGISGTTVVVGAPGLVEDPWGDGTQGSAYVYQLLGDEWVEVQSLIAGDVDDGDHFGEAVGIDGDRIIVGAGYDDEMAAIAGAAYIFDYDGTSWTETVKLTASDADLGDVFGKEVSITEGRVIVGATHNDTLAMNSGAAYIFELIGGIWTETAILNASDAFESDNFGHSVFIKGEKAIVGSERNGASGDSAGAAYLFEFDGTAWNKTTQFTASDPDPDGRYGMSVCFEDDLVVVGCGHNSEMGWGAGAVYVYEFAGGVWSESAKLIASDAEMFNAFGSCVGISEGTIICSGHLNNDNGPSSGSAYIFNDCDHIEVAFSFDGFICEGTCVDFYDESQGAITSWNWNFGLGASPEYSNEQHPTVCFDSSGVFHVQLAVTNPVGDSFIVENEITVYPLPELVLTPDTVINNGGTANVGVIIGTEEGIYMWEPANGVDCDNCPVTVAHPEVNTVYTVAFMNEYGCKVADSMMVLVNYNEAIGIPTAFSPNNDGTNDVLYVKGEKNSEIDFSVYNRYGELVFNSTDQGAGWDGTYNNKLQNPGVFTWVLEYTLSTGGSGIVKGNTTLIL